MSASRSLDREIRKARAEAALGLRPSALASTLIALEPRMVFDGAVAATVDAIAKQATDPAADHGAEKAATDATKSPLSDTAAPVDAARVAAAALDAAGVHAAAARVEIVFIDSRVSDAQAFATAAGPGRLVVSVAADQDGMSAVTDVLDSLGGKVEAIHIIGHGREGAFTLGATEIDADTVAADAALLAGWRAHLSQDADILLYGCDTGAGVEGAELIKAIAAETGADVAASTNDTGSRAGADWTLERSTGTIEGRILAPDGWDGRLAVADPIAELGGVDRTGLQVWLDASKLTAGSTLTQWTNQASGSDLTDVGKVGSKQPKVLSDATGNYVNFTGAGETIGLGSMNMTNRSIFMVLDGKESQNATRGGVILSQPNFNGVTNNYFVQFNNLNGIQDTGEYFQIANSTPVASGADYYKTQVMSLRFVGKSGVAETIDARSTAVPGLTSVGISSFTGSATLNLGGFVNVREVVIFNRSLSISESPRRRGGPCGEMGTERGGRHGAGPLQAFFHGLQPGRDGRVPLGPGRLCRFEQWRPLCGRHQPAQRNRDVLCVGQQWWLPHGLVDADTGDRPPQRDHVGLAVGSDLGRRHLEHARPGRSGGGPADRLPERTPERRGFIPRLLQAEGGLSGERHVVLAARGVERRDREGGRLR